MCFVAEYLIFHSHIIAWMSCKRVLFTLTKHTLEREIKVYLRQILVLPGVHNSAPKQNAAAIKSYQPKDKDCFGTANAATVKNMVSLSLCQYAQNDSLQHRGNKVNNQVEL